MRTDERLLAARNDLGQCLSKVQLQEIGEARWFLALQIPQSPLQSVNVADCVEQLQDVLMAFQIVKPIETYGLVFHGVESPSGRMLWKGMGDRRWPMIAGQWAQLRAFDEPLLNEAQAILSKVQQTMKGADIGKRNAVHLLQLALEHPHPLIACLLAVTGMEAILKNNGRRKFEEKLCDLLGAMTSAFPDWNSPHFSPPNYRVKDLALHLHTLRSKVAHGIDLREAVNDKKSPVDLDELKPYILLDPNGYYPQTEMVQYATLLGEAAIYLLGQVLQRAL